LARSGQGLVKLFKLEPQQSIPRDVYLNNNKECDNMKMENYDDDDEHQQYQNELKWNYASTYAFGVAVLIDLVSPLLIRYNPFRLDLYTMVSIHLYLLSAIYSIKATTAFYPSASSVFGFMASCGQKSPSSSYTPSISTRLILCGEWSFLFGSIIDVVISYISEPEIVAVATMDGHTLAVSSIVSSVLWLVDAILYLSADIIIFSWRTRKSGLHQH
jgi:hypothetical protein